MICDETNTPVMYQRCLTPPIRRMKMACARRTPVRLKCLYTALCLLSAISCVDPENDQSTEHDQPTGNEPLATLELEATFQEPFGYLNGIRELSDGRILAADPFNQVVLRIDMDAGTADTLGREGAGPQEYDGPDQDFPLPNDSTLLVDLGNGRLIVIDPKGEFVDWMLMYRPDRRGRLLPRYVDADGNFYKVASPTPSSLLADSVAIHRIDRATWVETPVAWGWRAPVGNYMGPQHDRKRFFWLALDNYAVGPDGRVAVFRINGNSVDWYLPDGRMIQGPPTDIETFPVRRIDKEAAVELHNTTVVWSQSRYDNGVRITRAIRGLPKQRHFTVDDYAWQDSLPVFRGPIIISPGGNAWVKRLMPAGELGRYEIFDRTGTRVGFIELPTRSTVIGFGSAAGVNVTAYVTRFDDVGWVWLDRYRIVRGDE